LNGPDLFTHLSISALYSLLSSFPFSFPLSIPVDSTLPYLFLSPTYSASNNPRLISSRGHGGLLLHGEVAAAWRGGRRPATAWRVAA
jgi:hypothetical protein